MNDIVYEHNLYMFSSDLFRIPDHAILCGKFKLSYTENINLPPKVSTEMSHSESDLKYFNQLHKGYMVDPISEDVMILNIWKQTLDNLTEGIEQRSSQEIVYRIYNELNEKILAES